MSLERRARAFLSALEAGASGEDLAGFYHPDVFQEEYPGRFAPAGASRDLDGVLAEALAAQRRFARQLFEPVTVTEHGDRILIEIRWSGELALPHGGRRAGDTLQGRLAFALEYEDARIIRQRIYPCIEPF